MTRIKSICITSSQTGEAKTTLSINLAYIFATKYNRVLLIDCDLRKPRLHKVFNTSNLIGLTSVLASKSSLNDTVKPVKDEEELMVITSSGIVIRTSVNQISIIGRATQGVKIMRVNESESEKVVSIASFKEEDAEEATQE